MNDEPVAWMQIHYKDNKPTKYSSVKTWEDDVPLYTHPAKELHLSLQKSKETGELLAVTYTDDEHRIVEVLWKKPPAKTLTDEEIGEIWKDCMESPYMQVSNPVGFARAILRKAQEK